MSASDLADEQLEAALRDLGAHLDLGPAGTEDGRAESIAAVLVSIGDGAGAPPRDRRGAPWLVAAATIAAAVCLATVAIAPAREAVARWLGIGGVRIERTDTPPPIPTSTATTPELPPAPTRPHGSVDVAALAARLPFAVRLPAAEAAGEPVSAAIDPAVPSGLIEVRYPAATFVALASQPGSTPVLLKQLGPGTETQPVDVDGHDGLWITGDPHQLAFLDPDGASQVDRVRGAGDVLLWEADGVTYRIEGAGSLEEALALAASMR